MERTTKPFAGLLALGMVLGLSPIKGVAQQPQGAEKLQTASDFAILARPPQAALPPLDCLRCYGPGPSKYCLPGMGPRGYLYYGTYPYNDDWFNGFNDCPGGSCGNPGAALGLAWIQLHNAFPRPRARLEQHHHPRAGGQRARHGGFSSP